MKHLRSLATATLLIASAPLAMAASASTADGFAQHGSQASHSSSSEKINDDLRSAPSTAPTGLTSGAIHSGNAPTTEAAPASPTRAPFWQALLPGSIQ